MNKNLKDTGTNSLKDISFPIIYNKTHKLITALYMVTDIIDSTEPIRNKLRALGVEILSDTASVSRLNIVKNVQGVLSFLDIAFTMNMISEMNKNILLKEFNQLKDSLVLPQDNPVWLEEFLKEDKSGTMSDNSIGHKGHLPPRTSTRIGVQKGSTLMKALSDKTVGLGINSNTQDFDMLKKERRHDIVKIIKANGGSATITDIRIKAQGVLVSCSEKTLQRELMSMIKDGVLKKEGYKRWTKYFIKSEV